MVCTHVIVALIIVTVHTQQIYTVYLDSTIRCYTQLGNNYAINKQRILPAVISVVSNQYLVLTHMMEGQEIIVLLYLKKATI